MSLYVYDADGYRGDAATPKGFADFCDVLRASGIPLLQAFADEGISHDPEGLADALDHMPRVFSERCEAVRENIARLARACHHFVMVTDGIETRNMVQEHADDDDSVVVTAEADPALAAELEAAFEKAKRRRKANWDEVAKEISEAKRDIFK